ncbi:MAG TPA: hypothetical protein EYP74_05845 [Anaerolineales bacterium]|nr:hypothetical protein [Anaerolineales bacterium]
MVNGDSKYTPLAEEFLERELEFQRQLDEDPDHHFWKNPTWEKILAQKYWLLGLILSLIMGITFINFDKKRQEEFQLEVAQVHATQTEEARFAGQKIVEYDAGTLSIINVEDPTNRSVTFGRVENEEYILATPASGARFLAVQVNFQCSLSICDEPPHANLTLMLNDGTSRQYTSSSRPFFVEHPPLSGELNRVAGGQNQHIWFVFEVSRSASPVSLRVTAEGQEEPQFLSWSVR